MKPSETAGEMKRRDYPRIKLHQPAQVRFANGQVAPKGVSDISAGGMQLRCNRALASFIHPTLAAIETGNWPKVVLAIALPYPKGIPEIVVECSLRYVSQIVSDEIAFGVKFERFKGDGARHFHRFITESLKPGDATE